MEQDPGVNLHEDRLSESLRYSFSILISARVLMLGFIRGAWYPEELI